MNKGTGTAPFRSFWQELDEIKSQNASFRVPKVWLFFGCRAKCLDLYSDEKREMLEKGILDKVFLALSREVKIPKVSLIQILSGENTKLFQNIFTYVDLRSRFNYEGINGDMQFN